MQRSAQDRRSSSSETASSHLLDETHAIKDKAGPTSSWGHRGEPRKVIAPRATGAPAGSVVTSPSPSSSPSPCAHSQTSLQTSLPTSLPTTPSTSSRPSKRSRPPPRGTPAKNPSMETTGSQCRRQCRPPPSSADTPGEEDDLHPLTLRLSNRRHWLLPGSFGHHHLPQLPQLPQLHQAPKRPRLSRSPVGKTFCASVSG